MTTKQEFILGISAFYHDSAACLVRDGEIVAAAQEERFTRKKGDAGYPARAVEYCLKAGGITAKDLTYVGFYDKPLLKFERILDTYLGTAPDGFKQFLMAGPLWIKEKLFTEKQLRAELDYEGEMLFAEHHESHAASAFFPSPFQEAALLTMDGVGEWATASFGVGKGNDIELLKELFWPDSLGLLYSAFTYYTGFKVNSGEYKVMGLAPYGEPKFVKLIYDHLIDLKDDGSFRLNQDYFDYLGGLTMTNGRFHELFGGPPRVPETKLSQRDMDLARSVQDVCEDVMMRMARTAHKVTGQENLCLAGGVALNCVGNGKILREGPFKNIWIQPAAGDAGGALGVAQLIWHRHLKRPRTVTPGKDTMNGSYFGPSFTDAEIETFLKSVGAVYHKMERQPLLETTAKLLAGEKNSRLVQRPDGVRAAGAGLAQHPGRPPEPQDAGRHEHQDQVPGRVPAVRAERAARAGVRLVRDGLRLAVHAAGGAGQEGAPDPDDDGAAEAVGPGPLERAALRHPSRHAHRLLGPRPDGEPGRQPRLLRPHRAVREADGLPGGGEYVVQRPRRADRVHAEGRAYLFHAYPHRRAGPGPVPAAQGRATGVEGDAELEAGIPARLTAAAGRKFGLTVGIAFLVLASLLHFWRHREVTAVVFGSLGALLVLAALLVPTRLGPLERAWMGLAKAISKVTTPVFMAVVFFIVVTPIGLLMRLLGRRALVHPEQDGGFWAAPASGGHSDMQRQF